MIPLGLLGQIYAVCASIGTIFVVGSFVLGHIGDEGGDGGGGDDGSDFGGSDDGGGTDFNAGDDGGGGTDFNAGDDGGNYRMTPLAGHKMTAGHRVTTQSTMASGVFGVILSLLSPMTVCVYLAFFGLTGLFLAFSAPWMGLFTLIPAILVSVAVSAAFKSMTKWMMRNMHTSSHQKESDLLGQMAEVNVPIHDGRTGEVTYVLNAKRMTASAQPAKPGLDFKKGSKVLIVGSREHVVLIEPYDPDKELEERFIS